MRIRTETGTAYFALNNAPAAKEARVLIRNIPADGYKDRPAEAGISVRTIESEEGMVISKPRVSCKLLIIINIVGSPPAGLEDYEGNLLFFCRLEASPAAQGGGSDFPGLIPKISRLFSILYR
jgi:hypothetical protein